MNNGKPDFSNVAGSVASSEAPAPAKPDFSNVTGSVASTEAPIETGGGGNGEQTYTVAKGDNLSKIAKHFYGKQDWKRIFDANRDQLDDPDRIFPGQVLKIPPAETAE